MIVRMLVSVSRSDGFSAGIGQEVELDDELAADLIANEMAETPNAPRKKKLESAKNIESLEELPMREPIRKKVKYGDG